MNLLNDVITYIRRIIKFPSNQSISDSLLIDYINRFWTQDVDARLQLFDLKTTYQFQTVPGFDQYNMPLYDVQTEPLGPISFYPVYQGFLGPAYVNGVEVTFQTQRESFFKMFPKIVQPQIQIGTGNGTAGPYDLTFPVSPNNTLPLNPPVNYILRGQVDMFGIIATGNNIDPPLVTATDLDLMAPQPFIQRVPVTSAIPAVYVTACAADGSNIVVCDSGQYLEDGLNYGILMQQGKAPNGNLPLTNGPIGEVYYSPTRNTIDYFQGTIKGLFFPKPIPAGAQINGQCQFFQSGLPRAILYYNNVITLRVPPATQYMVELNAYLTPAAFFNSSQSIPFAYMAEYIARGAARKILSDTGDVEQFQFYEPLFREQEMLVWKRSQRQFTATRTQTIFSQGMDMGQSTFSNYAQG